ncbi:WAT1-related protein-like protein [Salvia divinorum]|uniref:WAT1-related protein-like protein n=1 Tax=Salvia divinorum TaxID=28513 RepID=A0ABD1FJN9_SALDI
MVQLSLTVLVCFMGTLQSIIVTFFMEHRPHSWAIEFDMNLLAVAYAGIISSSISYYVQGMVMQKTGPVIVAITGSYILTEKIYVEGFLEDTKAEEILEPVKQGHSVDIEANIMQIHRIDETRMPSPVITISVPPMLALEAPKP